MKYHLPEPLRLGVILTSALFIVFQSFAQNRSFEDPYKPATDAYQDLWRRGRYSEALQRVNKEIVASANRVPLAWLLDRAEYHFQTGNVDEAIAEMEWLQYRRPQPQHALRLARYYMYRGRLPSSRQLLKNTIARFRSFGSQSKDPDYELALIQIRDLLGGNQRSLFQEMLNLGIEADEENFERHRIAAEMALRHFDYQLAATQFESALTFKKKGLEAMAGLAECYWKSYDPRLEEALVAIEEINPNHPRFLAIKAEQLLDQGKGEEALPIVEQFLQTNPLHFQFLGLKAGAFFMLDRHKEMSAVHTQAASFNPFSSEVLRITGRLASRSYRFEKGAAFQRRALEQNSEDHLARAFYGFDLLRLGRDEEGRVQLKHSFEGNRFNVQVYNMLEMLDNLAAFKEVRHGPFLLKLPERDAALWGGDALALLSEAFAEFTQKYRLDLDVPIHVQIFDNHDDFMVRSVGLPGSVGHLGICFGHLITMDSPAARAKGTMNWRSVLWHEFVHVITLQKTNNRISRWLSEGISVYEETLRDPSWGQRLDVNYKAIFSQEGLPGLGDLPSFFSQPKSQMHLMYGYFLGGEFVKFYVDSYGFPALLNALKAISKGTDSGVALLEACGTTTLDQEFKIYLERRFEAYKHLPNMLPEVMQLPFAADGEPRESDFMSGSSQLTQTMEKAQKALAEKRFTEAEAALNEAYALFPEFTGPDAPLTRLIDLYADLGNRERLKWALEKAMTLNGADFKAAAQLAEIAREEREWETLQRMANRGLSIDPFDVNMSRYRLKALRHMDQHRDALRALSRLILLDPNRALDYKLTRLDLLMLLDQTGKAKREVLLILEETPFSWEAQRRLLAIVAPKKPAEGGNERP